MRRRALLVAVIATLIRPPIARAQQPKIPRVGVLSPAENEATVIFEAFRRGLRELGYVEGRDIILEYRFAGGDHTALQRLAEELANLSVDIILTDGGSAAQAAAQATRTTPIVMGVSGGDPVALGVAASLARPGGNVTGFTLMGPELSAKWIELMHTAFPNATAVTALVNPANASSEAHFHITEETAHSLGLVVTRIDASSPEALRALRPEALIRLGAPILVVPDAMFWNHRREILALVAAASVPALYPQREYADDGGLIAYGPSVPDNFRRAAGYVDRILKGAKPGDLPIQEPVKFDFVVNLKTARALGLAIPQSILGRAGEVID
jgi:putative tryptophan/tyrosine transport system substrate-binding protein